MKKIWVAIIFLVIILSLCITETVCIDYFPSKISEKINSVEECVINSDYTQAKTSLDDTIYTTDKVITFLSTFTPTSRFTDLEKDLSLLDSLLNQEKYDDFIVICNVCLDDLSNLSESEKISIDNIL